MSHLKIYKIICILKINIDIHAMTINEYRIKKNYTFQKLAEELGFSDHSNPARLVQRWCQGLIPSAANIKKIKEATKGAVNADDFFRE